MFTCNHLTILCSDISRMKEFYVAKLGLEVLEDFPKVMAVRAGEVRFSFFVSEEEFAKQNRVQIILRTSDINKAKEQLLNAGVERWIFRIDVSCQPKVFVAASHSA